MIERVLLVAWKGSAATAWVETLESGGYTVLLEDTTGERAWRTAKERGIDCVIIDGQKKPSHGRQTGHALRDTAKTRNIPIIWTNLDPEDVSGVNTEVKPDVTIAAPTDATGALVALQNLAAQYASTPGNPVIARPPEPLVPARSEIVAIEATVTVSGTAHAEPVKSSAPAKKSAPRKKPAAKKPAPKKAAARKPAPKQPAAKKPASKAKASARAGKTAKK